MDNVKSIETSLWKDRNEEDKIGTRGALYSVVQYMVWTRLGNMLYSDMFPEAYYVKDYDDEIYVTYKDYYLNKDYVLCDDMERAKLFAVASFIGLPIDSNKIKCYTTQDSTSTPKIYYSDLEVQADYALDLDGYDQVRNLRSRDISGEWVVPHPSSKCPDNFKCDPVELREAYKNICSRSIEKYWKITDTIIYEVLKGNVVGQDSHRVNEYAERTRLIYADKLKLIGEILADAEGLGAPGSD